MRIGKDIGARLDFLTFQKDGDIHKKVGVFKCEFRIAEFKTKKQHGASILRPALRDYGGQAAPAYQAQRSQEFYWDEFWMMGLFCMGLNTLNN
jgi:hypothetical protein